MWFPCAWCVWYRSIDSIAAITMSLSSYSSSHQLSLVCTISCIAVFSLNNGGCQQHHGHINETWRRSSTEATCTTEMWNYSHSGHHRHDPTKDGGAQLHLPCWDNGVVAWCYIGNKLWTTTWSINIKSNQILCAEYNSCRPYREVLTYKLNQQCTIFK